MSNSRKYSSRPKTVARKEILIPGKFSLAESGQKAAHVCAICEEGGDLVFYDGPCMRHFHRSNVSRGAANFSCKGLLAPPVATSSWQCPDCVLKQAKCFKCGYVGNFEGYHGGSSLLRQCPDPLCIRFYCFTCLPPQKNSCALHTCALCGQPKSKSVAGMVHCLRCPTAWHLRCLKKAHGSGYCRHREVYEHTWHGHLRHMFYCHLHTLDPHLGTPVRDHVTNAIYYMEGAQ